MAIFKRLLSNAASNVHNLPGPGLLAYKAVSAALEVIPRTLVQNCGADAIRGISELMALHSPTETDSGIDGYSGKVVRSTVWDPAVVKSHTFKTAIECACLLLRVDEIVSGGKKKGADAGGNAENPDLEE